MTATAKRTIRLGLTAGLSLGAIVGVVGCAAQTEGVETEDSAAVQSENGLTMNGLTMNGLTMNGLAMNGLTMNGLTMNGLATVGGLSSTSGLMTTSGGRDIVKYMVKCAFPTGHSLTKTVNGVPYTFQGAIGIAPEAESGTCDPACQEKISACMLAHVNNAGVHIALWLDGPDPGVGWGSSPDYPFQEGAFFGNLFKSKPATKQGWEGYYCTGTTWDSGSVFGRLGSTIDPAGLVYKAPWGQSNGSNGTCPSYCSVHTTNGVADGYNSCGTTYDADLNNSRSWTHVVTVYRNFDSKTEYKICDYSPGLCLGVSGSTKTTSGASLDLRSYGGGTDQRWMVLEVSAGKYKLINKASGFALDINSTPITQNGVTFHNLKQVAYTGAASQLVAITPLSNMAGVYTVVPSSGTDIFGSAAYPSSGAIANTVPNYLAGDTNKWRILPVVYE
jgi:hypothetical protein